MLQENILKEAMSNKIKNIRRLPNIQRRILHSKRRILRSLMPNVQHPGTCYEMWWK